MRRRIALIRRAFRSPATKRREREAAARYTARALAAQQAYVAGETFSTDLLYSLFSRPQRISWKAAPYMGWPRL